MSFEDIRRAVQAHFAAGWGDETPVAWDNLPHQPAARRPWVRVSVLGSAGRQATLGRPGARLFRRRGHVFVQIFTPLAGGPAEAAALADKAAALFEGHSAAALTFAAADIRQSGEDSHGWWLTTVSVPYQADGVR